MGLGLGSSGNKWKAKAIGALASARALEGQQRDVEFQRAMLSNIRQQRLAQAQLAILSYNESAFSSNIAGASANINSALAGETRYGYETSQRMEKIQDYQEQYKTYMEKYAKQQKKKAGAFAVAGIALGAVTGGLGAGLVAGGMSAATGALAGATVGQGVGQIASNTGQFEQGLNNIIGGFSQAYEGYQLDNKTKTQPQFLLTSVNPNTGREIPGTTVKAVYSSQQSVYDFYKQ